MVHATPKLKAETRDRLGSKYAARLRKAGKLPVVIYGHGREVAHASVEASEIIEQIEDGAHLIELALDKGSETCLIKDIQFDYLGTTIIHLDLTRVDLDEEVTVEVPVHLKNDENCKALEVTGAILQHALTSIEVSCKANNIPDEVVIDVAELEVGETITVGDITLPEGVICELSDDTLIVMINVVEEQEEEAPEDAASAEPEVIGAADRDEDEEGEEDEDKD